MTLSRFLEKWFTPPYSEIIWVKLRMSRIWIDYQLSMDSKWQRKTSGTQSETCSFTWFYLLKFYQFIFELVCFHALEDIIRDSHYIISVSGTYFNCIMFMVASSVVTTIMILNYHHRKPDTHEMPDWVSRVIYWDMNIELATADIDYWLLERRESFYPLLTLQ